MSGLLCLGDGFSGSWTMNPRPRYNLVLLFAIFCEYLREEKVKVKALALYLPQYHRIPENDEWWEEGYTEWTAVRRAESLYKGHVQPKVPLGGKYYDLVEEGVETWTWQAELAQNSGIYGFCIYHYWFNGKLLLEKPMEILRDNPQINIRYCICWANEPWARTWDGKPTSVLMNQVYGGEKDITDHFDYLLSFFKDSRYIKIDNKPVVNLYRSCNITYLRDMLKIWNERAKENGFDGIYWVSALTSEKNDDRRELFDHYYYFEPGYTLKNDMNVLGRMSYLAQAEIRHLANTFRKEKTVERRIDINLLWDSIVKRIPDPLISPGIVVSWDNTPRKKDRGTVIYNSTPEGFGKVLAELEERYPETEFLYINAWNEWGEGAYLEPDEQFRHGYLDAMSVLWGRN